MEIETIAAQAERTDPYKKIGTSICLALLALLVSPVQAGADWRFSWRLDPKSGDYTCSAASDQRRVMTGPDGVETFIRLGIEGEGLMTIESDPVPFDTDRLYQTWVRVDENPMVVRLGRSGDGRTLTFSEEDSIALHRQFENGSVVTVAMMFASGREPVIQQFSLEGYGSVTAQFKGCRGLLLNPGWLGISMTDGPEDADLLEWIKTNTASQRPGIVIIAVDPRKAAYKSDIRPGDVIIGFSGQAGEVKDLIKAMKRLDPGKSIELDVVRNKTRLDLTVTRPKTVQEND